MPLTDPHRATVRDRLRPVIADDDALDALMSQFPASPAERPVTEARLVVTEAKLDLEMANVRTALAQLETRLSDKISAVQVRLLAILLPFTVAVMAVAVGLAAGLT